MQPLDDYYLWCDHRAFEEARQITELAREEKLEAIDWCGGVYSHEWGLAKLLHWLRNNPGKRERFASAFEHCDMVAATLPGVSDPTKVRGSICAMGHKWMWNPRWGGFPPQSFLSAVDPLFVREKLAGEYLTSDHVAGTLSSEWAEKLGFRPGIPIPVGAFDGFRDINVVEKEINLWVEKCLTSLARFSRLRAGKEVEKSLLRENAFRVPGSAGKRLQDGTFSTERNKKIARMIP